MVIFINVSTHDDSVYELANGNIFNENVMKKIKENSVASNQDIDEIGEPIEKMINDSEIIYEYLESKIRYSFFNKGFYYKDISTTITKRGKLIINSNRKVLLNEFSKYRNSMIDDEGYCTKKSVKFCFELMSPW